MQGVGPDINFKRIGFPTAKRPNLGVRKNLCQPRDKRRHFESYDPYICLYLDRKMSSSDVILYWTD